jgi:hypothetical protein
MHIMTILSMQRVLSCTIFVPTDKPHSEHVMLCYLRYLCPATPSMTLAHGVGSFTLVSEATFARAKSEGFTKAITEDTKGPAELVAKLISSTLRRTTSLCSWHHQL